MFRKKEHDSPLWLDHIDRIIYHLIRPVFNQAFSPDSFFNYHPSHYDDDDDIDMRDWEEDTSSFLYELQDGTSEFRINNFNDKYGIRNLNPHIFAEINHSYDISKIVKFDMQETNVIEFVSPYTFQPIKENLSVIEFDDCYFSYLPPGMFKDLHLKKLLFSKCKFDDLSKDFGLEGIGSLEKLVLYENIYLNNIDIRSQLKILEKSGTDIIFKSPLDPRDISLEEKIRSIYSSE